MSDDNEDEHEGEDENEEGPADLSAAEEPAGAAPMLEPGPERDAREAVLGVIELLAMHNVLSTTEVVREVNATGEHIPEGPIVSALEAMQADGTIECIMLGEPTSAHWRAPVKKDHDLRRGICMELVGLPQEGADPTGQTCAMITASINERVGSSFETESMQPLFDNLVGLGVLATRLVEVALPDAPDGEEPKIVDVAYYDFAPGILFKIIADGFDTMISPATMNARGGATAKRAFELEAENAKLKVTRDKALQDAETAKAETALWRERLTKRGLDDILAEVSAPALPAPVDPRGRPFMFSERIPVDDHLLAQFYLDTKKLRAERKRYEYATLSAKENAMAVKKTGDGRIAELETLLDDMEQAHADGFYLLRIEARRVFNVATHETEIRSWADDRLIKIETKSDLKASLTMGEQVPMLGIDPPAKDTEAAEASDDDSPPSGEPPAKVPPKRKPRKKKD